MSLSELRSTWERLTRDPAFRVGTIYAGASWFIIEAVDTLGGSTGAIRLLAVLLAAGFALLVPAVWLLTRAGSASGSTDKALRSPLSDGDGAEAALSADRRQPPGESGTTPELAGRRAGRRPGPWGTRVWATALAVTLMLAAGAWWLGTRPGRAVPAAATHIAVLPFHATGSDAARELGTGLVDLLSAAMDDVAGIRTVSSRSVLARTASARASTPGVPMTLEAALELGSDLGAGSVLMGSVTAANGRVRLNGEVRAVADGAVLAAAEAEGQEAEVLAVADALAVDLLRAMWRSGDPIPAVETASLTTRSPAALRWYLAGERHLRAMRMDSATAAFRQAVAADSTFALAWLRLTESTGWTDGDGTAESVGERRSYVVRARAFADRLPPRARSLVNAVDLVLDGDMASFDSLNAFVTRYPDDPHGWYLLGDARFHAALLGLHSSQEITEPFLQATRLDPAFALGLAHPLELALDRGDRAEYDRLLARYQAVATSDDVEEHELQARVRWAPRDSVLHHFLAEVRPLDARDTRRLNLLIGVLGNRVRLDPEVDPMIYVAAMDSVLALAPGNRAWQDRASFLAAANLLALGRGEEGLRRLDDWLALSPNLSGELPVNLERSLMRMVQAMEHDLPLTMVVGDIAMAEGAADEYPFI
ncbi:MAG TPA: hypothetical protein VK966_00360, partial [Longimicrobiales bacterium]|nr:hypothetical protein [Longimicrobiales bacterium]